MPPPNTPEEGLLPPGPGHQHRHHISGTADSRQSGVHAQDGPDEDSIDFPDNDMLINPVRPLTDVNGHVEMNSSAGVPAAQRLPRLEWPALEYVDEVSQNLWCPICQAPLVLPVVTKCGHVFCSDCFNELLDHNNNCCPLDRRSFSRDMERGRFPAKVAPRIIQNLLDELKVRCPNKRCGSVEPRSRIQRHYEDECPFTKVPCVDPLCQMLVKRMDAGEQCKHMMVQCPHCFGLVESADMDDHRDNECDATPKECEHCHLHVLRQRYATHIQHDCSELIRSCEYADAGCTFVSKRRQLAEHERSCVYGTITRMELGLRKEISELQDLTKSQETKIKHQEMLIKGLLESTPNGRSVAYRVKDNIEHARQMALLMEAMSNNQPESAQAQRRRNTVTTQATASSSRSVGQSSHDCAEPIRYAWEPLQPFQLGMGTGSQSAQISYASAGSPSYEERVESLQRRLAEQDARHSHMLLNEILPLQDQLGEMRTAISSIGMDLRFVIARQKSLYSGDQLGPHNSTAAAASGADTTMSNTAGTGSDAEASARRNRMLGQAGAGAPPSITPPRL